MKRIVWLTGISFLVLINGHLAGNDGPPIDRVEEDWELVISEPNPDEESPQILNVISPSGDPDQDFYIFELNHSTQPDYAAGGMQLQRWNGDYVRSWTGVPNSSPLSVPEETITYTLRVRLYDSHLSVSVRNGHSQTWGDFGGLSLRLYSPTSLSSLNGYRTTNSTAKSRIGYASHRVTRFVLKEVRYYSNGELVSTDETDRVVHEYTP